MSIEHCVIEGERCSKCCEVLTIFHSKNFRDWQAYVRRYGYSDDPEYKVDKIYHILRKISKRRAKKINPLLVKRVGNTQSYFTCKNLTSNGCSDYDNRPIMCSAFPHYGRTQEEWENSSEFKSGGLYHEDCTYHIPVVNL